MIQQTHKHLLILAVLLVTSLALAGVPQSSPTERTASLRRARRCPELSFWTTRAWTLHLLRQYRPLRRFRLS